MDKCEVFLSNGKSLVVSSSTEQLLNKITDEDGEPLESFVLLEDETGTSCYLNPVQVVTVSFSGLNVNKGVDETKISHEEEHSKENLAAIKTLSEDIENME